MYSKNNWIARVGTGLNRWRDLISNTLFELVNEPTTVTIPGTPFQVAWMENLENAAATASDYKIPDSVVTQQINITTSDNDITRLFVRINTTVTGGAITINRNGNGPKPLVEPDGVTPVTELSQDDKFYEMIEDVSVFFLAPSGGNEWGGLQFIVDTFSGRLYHCESNTDNIYELDLTTRIPINTVTNGSVEASGIGGTENRLYQSDSGVNDDVYEIDINTLLKLSQANSPGTNPKGIGCTKTRLFLCDFTSATIYELDLNTKLQISSAASPSTNPWGVGGIELRLYHTDFGTDLIYEIDVNTKLQISSVAAPNTNPRDIGGTLTQLFMCEDTADLIHELDVSTKLSLNTTPTPKTFPSGMGGLKSSGTSAISISKVLFDGIEYELTDDSTFRISGVSV